MSDFKLWQEASIIRSVGCLDDRLMRLSICQQNFTAYKNLSKQILEVSEFQTSKTRKNMKPKLQLVLLNPI